MNGLLSVKDEAAYCKNLPVNYFRNQIKLGTGPAFVRISAKRIFFCVADLEAWMQTWEHHKPISAKVSHATDID
jgi:hypothetical protein